MSMTLRPATPLDAGKIGAILSEFVAENAWMPNLHTKAEDIAHAAKMIERGWVTVNEDATGFLAQNGEEVNSLFIQRDHRRAGVGSALLDHAKMRSDRLQLWTFQANIPAQRFYEKHGFVENLRTDGRTNDERLPDIEYIWKRTL